ncbi:signal peptidase I [Planococcus halocryophilus]|nr:signal peptidase I [Planococcus halocryophilus]
MKRSLTASLSLLLLVAGCSDEATEPINQPKSEVAEVETITDPNTEPVIDTVGNLTSDMAVYDYRYDAMDRGNYEYYAKEVVIDTSYYEENEVARGDVIAYKETPDDEFNLTRIIALPGEKVKIESGQIYINEKQLDTFYGRAHRVGLDLEELKSMLQEENYSLLQSKENVESNINDFENRNVKEVTVPADHVYVIGDDWFRTTISGPFPIENIAGKVLGYKAEE